MPVETGATAPDFELPDQSNQPVKLSDFRGKKHVILVFYPLSFTRVCSSELCTLRDDLDGFDFPLLSDFWPHGEVARRYGVFDEDFGVALRGTFLIDTDGVVRYTTVNAVPDARDPQEVKAALAQLT